MLLRWGRRGVVAAALAVTHVTPSAVTTNYVNKVSHNSSVTIESRHVTPVSSTATYINRVEYQPSLRPKHVTPSAEEDTGGGGSRLALLLSEDQEIIDIITAIGPLLVRL